MKPVLSARIALSCLCLLLISVAAISAFAQAGRGSISGTITDTSGAVVPGVQVVLLDKETGATQHTVSSSAGLYSFVSLNPGEYQVTASHGGFASVQREKIMVSVDQMTEVNL